MAMQGKTPHHCGVFPCAWRSSVPRRPALPPAPVPPAHANRDSDGAWVLRPLGLTGSSAINSAQENSDCCGSGASSSRWPLVPFPLTGAGAWPFPLAGWALAGTSSTVGPNRSSWWPLPFTAMVSGSTSTGFQPSSTSSSSASLSAFLALANTSSIVSFSSSSSPLTILRARAIIMSSPSSPYAASPSSGSSPSTARELCIFLATSFSASAWSVFR